MKGNIIVKRLNKSGIYKSELDYDKAFINEDNKKGYFKMLIKPIENCDGEKEIRYMKVKGGYRVSGESYIVTGATEEEINKEAKHHHEKYPFVKQTEVQTEDKLW